MKSEMLMNQQFVITDARFTVFGNLIDGEKVAPDGKSLDVLFKDVVGVVPANFQRTQIQLPSSVASAQVGANTMAIQLHPGRADFILNANQAKASIPSIGGSLEEIGESLSRIGGGLFSESSEPNRIAVAIGGSFVFNEESEPISKFVELTGIAIESAAVVEPLFRANFRVMLPDTKVTLNCVKSFEVGQFQEFEFTGTSMQVKRLHVLRCLVDANCTPLDRAIDPSEFIDISSRLLKMATEFARQPQLDWEAAR